MALMFPRNISSDAVRSEKVLFSILRDQLDNDFTVMSDLKFSCFFDSGKLSSRQIDFLVIHKNYGFLIIEAKGGHYQFKNGKFENPAHPEARDPVEQAHSLSICLFEHLSNKLGINKLEWKKGLSCGWCLFFADMSFHENLLLHPLLMKEHLFTRNDLSDKSRFQNKIVSTMRAFMSDKQLNGLQNREYPFSEDLFLKVFNHLKPSPNINIALDIQGQQDRMIRLDEKQMDYLYSINSNIHTHLIGAAGTGKTLLAVEKAKMLASGRDLNTPPEGVRTLLLFWNRSLADVIRKMIEAEQYGDNLVVMNIHRLIAWLAIRSGQIDKTEKAITDEFYFADAQGKERLARCYQEAAERGVIEKPELGFDALIIDEAQDMSIQHLEFVKHILKHPIEETPIFAFYDNNQNIQPSRSRDPVPLKESFEQTFGTRFFIMHLHRNYRNTKKIWTEASKYYCKSTNFNVIAEGQEGEDVYYLEYDRAPGYHQVVLPDSLNKPPENHPEAVKVLKSTLGILDHLVGMGVKKSDIAVIRHRSHKRTAFFQQLELTDKDQPGHAQIRIGDYLFTDNPLCEDKDRIHCDSIHRFKGLEKPVVIITEIQKLPNFDFKDRANFGYTGLTRSCYRLYVLGNKRVLDCIKNDAPYEE